MASDKPTPPQTTEADSDPDFDDLDDVLDQFSANQTKTTTNPPPATVQADPTSPFPYRSQRKRIRR